MTKIILRVWRLMSGPLQWRALYLGHAKFNIAVTGICEDDSGRILLIKHRFWSESQPWGLPSGYAQRSEEVTATLRREVREETGYELGADIDVIRVRTGFKLRIECLTRARVVGGEPAIDSREVLECGFFDKDDLPTGLLTSHREILNEN